MNIDYKTCHAYALGYYDGRVEGRMSPTPQFDDLQRHAYVSGYEAGVADYCEFDEE